MKILYDNGYPQHIENGNRLSTERKIVDNRTYMHTQYLNTHTQYRQID